MMRVSAIAGVVWLGMLRRKDLYVLFILLGAFLMTIASLDVFGLGGMTRYVADTGLLMAWVFAWILAVMAGAREIPLERTRGTLLSLLAKPLTRGELIAGKWLGVWTSVCAATAVFYALVAGLIVLRQGRLDPVALAQAFTLHGAALAAIVALAILFSVRLNSDAASTLSFVLTAAAFLVVPRIPEFMAAETGGFALSLMLLYNLLPHLEVFDMRQRVVHGFGPVDGATFGSVILYGAALTVFFLFLAWLAFRRKRFARGEQAF